VQFCDCLPFSVDCRADGEKWNNIQLYFIYIFGTLFNTPSFPCIYIFGIVLAPFSFPCIYIFCTVFNTPSFPCIYIYGTVLTHLLSLVLTYSVPFLTPPRSLVFTFRYCFNSPSFPCVYIFGTVFNTASFPCADDVGILRLYRRSNNVMEKGRNNAKENPIKQTLFRNKSRLIS